MNELLTDIEKAIDQHINKMDSIVHLLEHFDAEPISFPMSIDKPDWSCFDGELKTDKLFMYIIRAPKGDKESVLRAFDSFKTAGRGQYRLSSVNHAHRYTDVLYVGTSSNGHNSLKARLSQHLGLNGKMAYSLQLKHWFGPVSNEVIVEVISVEEAYSDALYALENALWDYFQPLFGKKGANVNSSHKQ